MPGRGEDRGRRAGRGREPAPGRRPARPRRHDDEQDTAHPVRKASAERFGLSTTRRAAVFAVVVCALALSVAVPLRTYLTQRAEVAEQEQKAQELRGQVAELEAKKSQLSDPAQIKAEARRRLRYVMPGETPYIVQLPGDENRKPGESTPQPVQQQPWYQLLWNSVMSHG